MVLSIIGGLLFVSVFFTAASNFGNFDNFNERASSEMFRAFGGMALLVIGSVLMGIGRKGLAGSGIVLDPEKARDDVEPWSRMSGGMMNDALSEVDLVQDLRKGAGKDSIIKVRCRGCGALNDEDAKFCDQCSQPM